MKKVSIQDLIDNLEVNLISGSNGLNNQIKVEDYHRPGLQLTGFYDLFAKQKVQLIGRQEAKYILSLKKEKRDEAINNYVKMKPPCIIITNEHKVATYFENICEEQGVPLLTTSLKSAEFTMKLMRFLEKELAQEVGIHGVCVDVFGIGMIIRGDSGIGKSEAALSLIERGHRLIADDLVVLKKLGPEAIIGTHNGLNSDFLALRGIGLINIPRLYGSGSIQQETRIKLDIYLSAWDGEKYYDAVHAEERVENYLGVDIKSFEIPVKPGRDVAALIEVAAKNWRLQQNGYRALDEFEERIKKQYQSRKIDE